MVALPARLHRLSLDPTGFPAAEYWILNAHLLDPGPQAHATKKADCKIHLGATDEGCSCAKPSTMVTLPYTSSPPQAHLVVYHVDYHGSTSHMGIHVVKVDRSNHDKNHVVIHMDL